MITLCGLFTGERGGGTSWAVSAGVLGCCGVSRECSSCRGDGVTERAGVNGLEWWGGGTMCLSDMVISGRSLTAVVRKNCHDLVTGEFVD